MSLPLIFNPRSNDTLMDLGDDNFSKNIYVRLVIFCFICIWGNEENN